MAGRSPIQTLAFAAALLLAIGLPRLVVLCHHDGEASLEFAHAHGDCCEHPPAAPEGDDPAAVPHEDCEHTSLAVDVAPTPKPNGAGIDDAPPPASWVPPGLTHRTPERTTSVHPPATGPPRTDRRTWLRASSLLLI